MKKCIKPLVSVIVALLAIFMLLAGCALREFGQIPQDTSAYETLPYFTDGAFHNQEDLPHYPDRIRGGKAGRLRFILPNANAPDETLPMAKLDGDTFSAPPEELAAYWLGHSSLIIELEGKRVLVDPVFGNAAPIPFVVRRYGPPPLEREKLPLPDYVLITHDHYDHLEYATISYFNKGGQTRFIVPLGAGAHLIKWGVPLEKIHELGWGDEFNRDGIRIIAERALHYSGRTDSTRNSSLWVSYVLKGNRKRVFISGDTGYSEHLRAIGAKHGPFDLAFFEIDGWNPGWPKTHLFPDEVIRAYHDVRAEAMIPVHWGVFDLAIHPWDESIRMIAALADEDDGLVLLTPLMGQKLVPGRTQGSRWWEKFPPVK